MTKKDTETEEVIKQAAKHLFFVEGRFNATTQEIADAAGVNRTLLNYYFRSRNKLFELVLKDARFHFKKRMRFVFSLDLDFRSKMEQFIDVYLNEAITYPYLETYMVAQLNQQLIKHEIPLEHEVEVREDMDKFFKVIESEMEKGTIEKMAPIQFVWNLLSLLSFPIVMKPIYKRVMDLDDKAYFQLLEERKKIIMSMIFKKQV
ncbi:TetR/AcrR family transcriptional regulator [Flavilitoribacter nigricans]|uniref:TetR family transcriptional regulator n=1 Tax=Flavilitoribacter nigricans (strain ATCC 23147 / DSM 23189 / NBRC 102662 / NCIMB 1420 / SS-2) TaxID=1122177 RepID=A0A2D0MWX0_FLAN2|nr:TetR/AcrR family transcriptional regulator [Flavilitoribacter nigricans]PHN00735.1 TetR family transcriptional regulator [Flavilitoribacter nigricans DSM 23189 = NBRC 102662]